MDQNNNRSPCKKPDLIRKKRKPLMEKRRRARINASLEQLKKLVLDATRKDSARYSKLEKADILELTVRHLRDIQRSNISCALTHNPHVLTQFNDGFVECASEVDRYLSTINGVSRDAHMRILTHLSTLAQKGRIINQPPSPVGSNCGLGLLPNMSVFLKAGAEVCSPPPNMTMPSPTPSATSLQTLPGVSIKSSVSPSNSPTSSSIQEQMWPSYHKLPLSPPSSPRDNFQEKLVHQSNMRSNSGILPCQRIPTAVKEYNAKPREHQQHQFRASPVFSCRPDIQRECQDHMVKSQTLEENRQRMISESQQRMISESQHMHHMSTKALQMFRGVDDNVWRPW